MSFSDEPDAVDLIINHIFASGLTLASLVGRPEVNAEVARRLQEVIEELDMAVIAIRRSAFTALLASRRAHPDPPEREPIVVAEPEPVVEVRAASNGERRRLRRTTDDGVFAYAMRGDFYRVRDHELWAHESEDLLLSARSGRPLARRAGNVFYDLETKAPLYYEDNHSGRLPVRPCGGSSAVSPVSGPSPPVLEEGVT